MALTDREDRLVALALATALGDGEIRDAVIGLMCEKLGFSRSGGSPTGALLVPGSSAVGVVTTPGTTAVEERGNGIEHLTKLTMTDFAVGTIPDLASLGFGAKFYTFPAGSIYVDEATISGGLTGAVSVTAQTPEVGIGTVIASGAIATLTTGTFENLIDGGAAGGTIDAALVAPDIAGAAFNKANLSTARGIIKATGGAARDLFLNVAASWADVAAPGALTFTGVITLRWRKIN